MNAPEKLSVAQAKFLRDPGLQHVFESIEAAGGQVRINGGAVRNALLGQTIADVDLSTTLEPPRTMEVLQRAGVKVVPTGIDHGTITAVSHGKGFEITTLREDVTTDGRHAAVKFGSDWTADALRRDFTFNALYCDRHGRLYDPLNGYADLVARRIRFIGDPQARISEDRLRILRFFRFFAWYGKGRPDAEALKACAGRKQELASLSAERIWHELKRLLAAPVPVRAMLWIRTAGVLDVILPESSKWGADLVARLSGAETALGWKHDSMLRLMAIIPPRTDLVKGLSTRLKLSNHEASRLLNWANAALADPEASSKDLARLLYGGNAAALIDRLKLERARLEGAQGSSDAALRAAVEAKIRFAENWKRPDFPLKGEDLLAAGMAPGPPLGKALARLEKLWIESDFTLSRRELLGL